MTEEKQSRLGKWKRYVCIALAALLLVAVGVYIFFPGEMYHFLAMNSSFSSHKHLPTWELRRATHAYLKRYHCSHDDFINLIYYGNKGSVPILIDSLGWAVEHGGFGTEDYISCTWRHCKDALRSLTGEDYGFDNVAWRKWWDSVGKNLPQAHFKLRENIKRGN